MSVSVLPASSALPSSRIETRPLVPAASLSSAVGQSFDDWRSVLFKEGVVVVPDVLTKDKAAGYVARAHDWLEHFDIGYIRDDPSTWKLENLPHNNKGGLYGTTGICHSQLVWDIRQEKGVIDAFARIWGTDELLVSFDGMNIGVPLNLDDEANKGLDAPWAHTDQSPLRDQLATVQGIVNLAENGPLDGGLTVFRGSQQHFRELFETFEHLKPEGGWSNMDWYAHPPEMLDWLKARGCYWEKICAPPGALILWDSRLVHYGAIPLSNNARVAAYVCYKPASLASDEVYDTRKHNIENLKGTSHDPIVFRSRDVAPPDDNNKAWLAVKDNLAPPELSPVGRKLAGLDRY